jgi:DNA-binding response OmpR family regulator
MADRPQLSDAPPLPDPFRFGGCELHLGRRQLLVDGEPAALGSRAFDLLVALCERRERVVSKNELLAIVWPGTIVEENNLQVHVSALRKLLGAQVIATVAGRGYRFVAEAALAHAPAARAPVAPVEPVALPPAAATGPARLLVVDDNKVNRLLLTRSLELLGHQVTSAHNGRVALELLRRERFDLMLLDLEMPELDGFGLLEQLAVDAELRDLPVIVTSSLEGVSHVARCIELGADDFLHKPVNPVLLKARVGASLEKKRLHDRQKALVQRFAASAVAQELQQSGVALDGQRVAGTVLVVRLREFDALAESMTAPEAVELVNSWMTLMFDAVDGGHGTVTELTGDGLVALFGAPLQPPKPADAPLAAVRAALDMLDLVEGLNAERAALGKTAVRIAIGVASGALIAGYMGTVRRASFGCIGAPVQAATRLQARAAGCEDAVLIDAVTREAVAARVATAALPKATGQAPAFAVRAQASV